MNANLSAEETDLLDTANRAFAGGEKIMGDANTMMSSIEESMTGFVGMAASEFDRLSGDLFLHLKGLDQELNRLAETLVNCSSAISMEDLDTQESLANINPEGAADAAAMDNQLSGS
ncbi:MAG: hypothetical protein ACRDXX_09235 [Stackebrandtia sp.]